MAVGYFQGLLDTPVCPPVSVALESTCWEVLEAAICREVLIYLKEVAHHAALHTQKAGIPHTGFIPRG